MFSVAELLDRAKAKANIDTDYRLAKVIGINQSGLGNYRAGRSYPDERVLEQLCALSGDDLAVWAAQLQSERARTAEGKAVWQMIAKRLAGGATTAMLSVVFAIAFIAGSAGEARASGLHPSQNGKPDLIYIVSSAILSACSFFTWHWQRWRGLFRLSFAVCLLP